LLLEITKRSRERKEKRSLISSLIKSMISPTMTVGMKEERIMAGDQYQIKFSPHLMELRSRQLRNSKSSIMMLR